jgi:hypothetical protein
MIKNEIRAQLVNELYNTCQLYIGREQLIEQIGKVVDKHLSRLTTPEDKLTKDSYGNPLYKLMRNQAYTKGCYGCQMSTKEGRKWLCLAEAATNEDLNYPNASRDTCKWSVKKTRSQ